MEVEIEKYPLKPFLLSKAKLLMLGGFSSQRERWSMDSYYPNPDNDMWRIVGLLFFGDKDHFSNDTWKVFYRERIIDFLNEKGIALFDTASFIRRLQDNASDKFLEVVRPTDIAASLHQLPEYKTIVTAEQKATDIFRAQPGVEKLEVGDYVEFVLKERAIRLYRMPSSSWACPLVLDKRAAAHRIMYRGLQMII